MARSKKWLLLLVVAGVSGFLATPACQLIVERKTIEAFRPSMRFENVLYEPENKRLTYNLFIKKNIVDIADPGIPWDCNTFRVEYAERRDNPPLVNITKQTRCYLDGLEITDHPFCLAGNNPVGETEFFCEALDVVIPEGYYHLVANMCFAGDNDGDCPMGVHELDHIVTLQPCEDRYDNDHDGRADARDEKCTAINRRHQPQNPEKYIEQPMELENFTVDITAEAEADRTVILGALTVILPQNAYMCGLGSSNEGTPVSHVQINIIRKGNPNRLSIFDDSYSIEVSSTECDGPVQHRYDGRDESTWDFDPATVRFWIPDDEQERFRQTYPNGLYIRMMDGEEWGIISTWYSQYHVSGHTYKFSESTGDSPAAKKREELKKKGGTQGTVSRLPGGPLHSLGANGYGNADCNDTFFGSGEPLAVCTVSGLACITVPCTGCATENGRACCASCGEGASGATCHPVQGLKCTSGNNRYAVPDAWRNDPKKRRQLEQTELWRFPLSGPADGTLAPAIPSHLTETGNAAGTTAVILGTSQTTRNKKTVREPSGLYTTSAQVTLKGAAADIEVIVHQWQGYEQASSDCKAKWDVFYDAVLGHELRHVIDAKTLGEKVVEVKEISYTSGESEAAAFGFAEKLKDFASRFESDLARNWTDTKKRAHAETGGSIDFPVCE